MEKQRQLSHPFHRPLEISQAARDSHIPTARLRARGKVENQTQVFHFPTAARDYHKRFATKPKTPRKEIGRCAASSSHFSRSSCIGNGTPFQDHFWIRKCSVPYWEAGTSALRFRRSEEHTS